MADLILDNGAKNSNALSVKIFENPEFGRVRTCLIEDAPWFVGKDVAEILGYKNTNAAVTAHVDDEDKKIVQLSDLQDCPKAELPDHMKGSKIVIINKDGLISLIQKAERVSRATKKSLIEYFGLEDKFYVIERKEINFGNDLIGFFKGFGFEVKRQFRIGIYHADFYVPKFHLVIEYDEDGHSSYDKRKEKQRESYIKDAGFDVVRVDSRDSNVFNLGIITNYILMNRNE